MAEQIENSGEIGKEQQQLNEQLENICLDYQLLVKKGREMAPKGTQSKKSDPNTENVIDDDDLEGEWVILCELYSMEKPFLSIFVITVFVFVLNSFICAEIANVADNLDSLESALDMIEERADRIREQLLELLTSNREIRQSIQEENQKLRECESKDNTDENNSSKPEEQQPNEHQE